MSGEKIGFLGASTLDGIPPDQRLFVPALIVKLVIGAAGVLGTAHVIEVCEAVTDSEGLASLAVLMQERKGRTRLRDCVRAAEFGVQ